MVQESIEGLTAIIAVVVLTWMLFWMRRQGRAIKGELEHGVDIALAGGSLLALAGLAFVSVAREGLETVLFLFAIGSSSGPVAQTLLAAFAGLRSPPGSAGRSSGGHPDRPAALLHDHRDRPDLRVGRTVAFAVHEFGEAGPDRQHRCRVRPRRDPARSSPVGAVLAGLFGYRSAPTPLEVIGYFAYLIPVLTLFLKPARRPTVAPAAAAS